MILMNHGKQLYEEESCPDNYSGIRTGLILGALVCTFFLLLATTANAVTVTVAQDGTGDYNGSTDVNIQAAIDYVNTQGGGTVHIKQGTYVISNSLEIGSNFTFEGDGNTTILYLSNSTNKDLIKNNDFFLGNTNITIKDVQLNGNRQNQLSSAAIAVIDLNNVTHTLINNVFVLNGRQNGIAIINGQDSNILDSNFESNVINGSGGAIHIVHGSTGIISGNKINNTQGKGIYLDTYDKPYLVNYVSNFQISNNIITNTTGAGGNGFEFSGVSYTTVENNTISDSNTSGLNLEAINYCIISNNTVQDSNVDGIHIIDFDKYPSSVSNNVVQGNIIKDNGRNGITLFSRVVNNEISGNLITLNSGSGIFLSDANSNIIIDNNILENNILSSTNKSGLNFSVCSSSNTATRNIINEKVPILQSACSYNNLLTGNIYQKTFYSGIFNQGFENGTGNSNGFTIFGHWVGDRNYGWQCGRQGSVNDSNCSFSNSVVHSGTQSMKLNGNSSASGTRGTAIFTADDTAISSTFAITGIPQNNIYIKPNTTYRLSAWYYVVDGNSQIFLHLFAKQAKSDGTQTGTESSVNGTVGNSWNYLSKIFTTNSDANQLGLGFACQSTIVGYYTTCYLDDLSLEELESIPLFAQAFGKPRIIVTGITDINADRNGTNRQSSAFDLNVCSSGDTVCSSKTYDINFLADGETYTINPSDAPLFYEGDNNVYYMGHSDSNFQNTTPSLMNKLEFTFDKPTTTITRTRGIKDNTENITLTCTSGTTGACSTITYSINGGTSQTYSGTFTLNSGTYTITYYSTDDVGNQESTNTTTFTILTQGGQTTCSLVNLIPTIFFMFLIFGVFNLANYIKNKDDIFALTKNIVISIIGLVIILSLSGIFC